MNDRNMRIERQELYDEVWSTPMVILSRTYGISDVGLTKVCKKLNIPVPGRGYWRKKEVGQQVDRVPLPPLKAGQVGFTFIQRTRIPATDPADTTLIENERQPANRIVVESRLDNAHPLTSAAREGLEEAAVDTNGILTVKNQWCPSIKVSRSLQDRALRIMDALFKAFDDRGFSLAMDRKTKTMSVFIQGENVAFMLEEFLDRKERELSPTQKKDKEKNPWKYPRPEYHSVPSGKLSLKITDPSWNLPRHSWTDGKRQKVEECLNSFVAALVGAAAAVRESRIEQERRQRERAEQERLANERKRRKRDEQRNLWALLSDSVCWQRSRQIREFVQAVKEAAGESTSGMQQDSSLDDWIAWANDQADALDPLSSGARCMLDERYKKPSFNKDPQRTGQNLDLVWERILRRSKYFEQQRMWHYPDE
jgi:hypothetical protein